MQITMVTREHARTEPLPHHRAGRLAASALLAILLAVTTVVVSAVTPAPAGAAGVDQYGAPEWLPLRTTLAGGDLLVGCTFQTASCGGHHGYWALDLGLGSLGAPVFGAGAGQVIEAGFQSGWGNYVRIDHGPFGDSLYAHLSRIDVGGGQWVDQNTQLGAIGQTGSASTPHLHYEYYDLVDAGSDDPGDLQACHGNTLVRYGSWSSASNTRVHSDGTMCGVTLPDLSTRFVPIEPARILDSRSGATNIGPYDTPWGSSPATRDINVAGQGGVPFDADAAVLNVTVVNATAPSYLQLWPNGAPKPFYGSSLNFDAGQIVANAVTVRIGDHGQVRILNAGGSVDIVVDVVGYYREGSGGAGFEPVTPARLVDSRPGPSNVGGFSTPWPEGVAGARDIQVGGLAGVPADAVAVTLNVTVVNPTAASFLQLWPSGSAQPTFGSSLNFNAGQIVPNAATVKLGPDGSVRILNAGGSVDVVVDVTGYYTAVGGSDFHPVLPDRVLDSRPASNVGSYSSPWGPGGARPVQVAGRGGVPGGAKAVVLNITAVAPSSLTFVQLWPTGVSQPAFGSSLNAAPGQIVPNAATVGLGWEGDVMVFNAAGSVDLVADVAGSFG